MAAHEWDPTGRYFTTVVSAWRSNIENGYRLFNFQGKELRNALKDKFYQLLWRPRPPTPLSEEKLKVRILAGKKSDAREATQGQLGHAE